MHPILFGFKPFAEEFHSDLTFDLITAAASIHWMDPAKLFPALAVMAAPNCVFAVISGGDEADHPDWQSDWETFLKKWVPVVSNRQVNDLQRQRTRSAYRDYLDVFDEDRIVSAPYCPKRRRLHKVPALA